MSLIGLMRMTVLGTVFAAGLATGATAQTPAADPHHPDTTLAQAPAGQAPTGQAQGVQQTQPGGTRPGMIGPGMMGQGMMGQGMMGDMMRSGMMGGMPMMAGYGHMKVMFAIADTNGDGALSFEEVTAIHKRIFDRVDANKDGKVTIEELQAFMRE